MLHLTSTQPYKPVSPPPSGLSRLIDMEQLNQAYNKGSADSQSPRIDTPSPQSPQTGGDEQARAAGAAAAMDTSKPQAQLKAVRTRGAQAAAAGAGRSTSYAEESDPEDVEDDEGTPSEEQEEEQIVQTKGKRKTAGGAAAAAAKATKRHSWSTDADIQLLESLAEHVAAHGMPPTARTSKDAATPAHWTTVAAKVDELKDHATPGKTASNRFTALKKIAKVTNIHCSSRQ